MTSELTDGLSEILASVRGGSRPEILDLVRLSGGASRETWSFVARVAGRPDEPLILQRERAGSPRGRVSREAAVLRAAAGAGMKVPDVVTAAEERESIGAAYMILSREPGEALARRILREPEFAAAREALVEQCAQQLALLHAVDVSDVDHLELEDPLRQYRDVADLLGVRIPTFELAFRRLESSRPRSFGPGVVHGDFRLGNLLVTPDGLSAVLDWELAHAGDPVEDLGWLCTRAWRFGAQLPVAGLGTYEELCAHYEANGGITVDRDALVWWETMGTLKWGLICVMQARTHLDGLHRSVELATIGRRVCETEHDLLRLLYPDTRFDVDIATAMQPSDVEDGLHRRPTAAELIEAVEEFIDGEVTTVTDGRARFHARVARRALATVRRELTLGPEPGNALARRLSGLGFENEAELADSIRAGRVDDRSEEIASVAAQAVAIRLAVANPHY